VREVFELDGTTRSCETVYGLTSAAAQKADPVRLLDLARDQWGIKNSLHWVRDVTFDETAVKSAPDPAHESWPHYATSRLACCALPAPPISPQACAGRRAPRSGRLPCWACKTLFVLSSAPRSAKSVLACPLMLLYCCAWHRSSHTRATHTLSKGHFGRCRSHGYLRAYENPLPTLPIALLNEGTLGNWVNTWKKEHPNEETPLTLPERARLRELEREVSELRMHNEFLKKAAAFFAFQQR
jgi:hypothetical protein